MTARTGGATAAFQARVAANANRARSAQGGNEVKYVQGESTQQPVVDKVAAQVAAKVNKDGFGGTNSLTAAEVAVRIGGALPRALLDNVAALTSVLGGSGPADDKKNSSPLGGRG